MERQPLTPIRLDNYKPLRELVFESLREAIISGKLGASERLMEIQMAEEMGVSRTPVREAIRKLELEGLVVMAQFRASRKHVVKPRTPKKNIRKTEPTEKRGEHRECRFDARKNFVNGHVNSDLHLSDLSVPMISFGRGTCTARGAVVPPIRHQMERSTIAPKMCPNSICSHRWGCCLSESSLPRLL